MNTEYYRDPSGPRYHGSGGVDEGTLAVLGFFAVFVLLIAAALYVVQAIFLSKILKNADHKSPVAGAWVPIWNTASLLQVGGIKQAWAWTAVLLVGGLLGSHIPFLGPVISIAMIVLGVLLYIWLAKGLQAALRTGGTGGIVLAVLLPFVWIIWMGVVSGRNRYDRESAFLAGGELPINWFGEGDRDAAFLGAASTAYAAGNPGYGAPGYGAAPGYGTPGYGTPPASTYGDSAEQRNGYAESPAPGAWPVTPTVEPQPERHVPTGEAHQGFSLPPIVEHSEPSVGHHDVPSAPQSYDAGTDSTPSSGSDGGTSSDSGTSSDTGSSNS